MHRTRRAHARRACLVGVRERIDDVLCIDPGVPPKIGEGVVLCAADRAAPHGAHLRAQRALAPAPDTPCCAAGMPHAATSLSASCKSTGLVRCVAMTARTTCPDSRATAAPMYIKGSMKMVAMTSSATVQRPDDVASSSPRLKLSSSSWGSRSVPRISAKALTGLHACTGPNSLPRNARRALTRRAPHGMLWRYSTQPQKHGSPPARSFFPPARARTGARLEQLREDGEGDEPHGKHGELHVQQLHKHLGPLEVDDRLPRRARRSQMSAPCPS